MDVAQIMSRDPITVSPDLPVLQARHLLEAEDIRHAPVVEGGRLVGVVSDRDLVPVEEEVAPELAGAGGAPLRTVADVMHRDITTVAPEDTVVTAAVDFTVERIGCLPVLSDGALVGILSEMDMLVAFSRACRDGGLVDPADHPPVADLMTENPLAVSPDTTVAEAIGTCRGIHARHLPVVADGRRLAGIVSSRDLVRSERAGRAHEQTVADVMAGEVLTVGPQDATPDAAVLMATAKVSALPVVHDGGLVGILTLTDLLNHCMGTLREPDGST